MRKYRNYTDEDVIREAKNSKSIAGLLKRLGLRCAGGNYANMKHILQSLNVDTSHWTGQGWSVGQQLKDWREYTKVEFLKKHLRLLKNDTCEKCKLDKWNGEVILLEVHHKDGDRTNNDLSNLELLCCNCHAQTDFYRNKKRKDKKSVDKMEMLV